MAVTRASVIKGFHDASRLSGDKRVAADYSMQIDGFEDRWLLCKSQFWPELTAGEGIEVPTPLGAAMWQASQCKFHQQSQMTFQESKAGIISQMFKDMLICEPGGSAASFNAWIYYGTPEAYIQRARIEYAFLTAEPVETDWENRTQIITIPTTIFYHYYGQTESGAGELC